MADNEPAAVEAATRAEHREDCSYILARFGSVAIECEHGYDVCPKCDACTCRDNEGDEVSP